MSTNANTANETNGNDAIGEVAKNVSGAKQKTGEIFNNLTSKAGEFVQNGASTLRSQYETVREQGFEGVRKDVTDYARKEPLKALLVAGGIGALAALILRRR
jgi:ElaB/YqjD/DUF883 family membrane-anchored ribosome-binding protein